MPNFIRGAVQPKVSFFAAWCVALVGRRCTLPFCGIPPLPLGSPPSSFFAAQCARDSAEEMEKAFQLFDLDKTGRITLANLKVPPAPI